jgi:hypothetical protein
MLPFTRDALRLVSTLGHKRSVLGRVGRIERPGEVSCLAAYPF